MLEDEAQKGKPLPGQGLLGKAPDGHPFPEHLPLLQGEKAREEVEEGGLAASRGPQEGQDPAPFQGKGKPPEEGALPVGEPKTLHLEDGRHPLMV
ncbi:hypothetical protein Thermus77838_15270 [Thermus oshimai]